jgi:hypothetical protein
VVSFILRQDDNNYLRLSVLAKAHPHAWDAWDGNLIRTRVEYAVSGQRDSYETVLFTDDLESFRDELTGDVVDESGIIALKTIDGVVSIEMERFGAHFVAECCLSKVPDGVADALFALKVSLEDAASVVRELNTILATVPIVSPADHSGPGDLTPPSRN